jgi:antitoxin MazE
MLIKLIKIGNSFGIRLPKSVIKECGFELDINLEINDKKVILTPYNQDRSEWYNQIQQNEKHSNSCMEAWKW